MSTHSRSIWELPSRGAPARLHGPASYFSIRLCVDTAVESPLRAARPVGENDVFVVKPLAHMKLLDPCLPFVMVALDFALDACDEPGSRRHYLRLPRVAHRSQKSEREQPDHAST